MSSNVHLKYVLLTRGMVQTVEHKHSKHEELSSNPNMDKINKYVQFITGQ
jgi:hypothetical protein